VVGTREALVWGWALMLGEGFMQQLLLCPLLLVADFGLALLDLLPNAF
jgi:hypothetical protein